MQLSFETLKFLAASGDYKAKHACQCFIAHNVKCNTITIKSSPTGYHVEVESSIVGRITHRI